MKFTKMQGIGNDYVYVNCFKEEVKDPAAVARFVSDRHFGIGSDGLIRSVPQRRQTARWICITWTVLRELCAEMASVVWQNTPMITALWTRRISQWRRRQVSSIFI